MNDLPLRILVERIIRPVRASSTQKMKMREELLAHLTAVFEEETQCDSAAALERTIARFGPPAEVTAQLQASLPRRDRAMLLIEDLIGFPPRDSALNLAARHALLIGAIFAVLVLGAMVITGRWSEWLTLARLPALLTPLSFSIITFGASLLGAAMHRALFGVQGPRWWRLALISIAASLLVPAVTFMGTFAISGAFATSFAEAAALVLVGWLLPVVLFLVVQMAEPEMRHHDVWAKLQID